MLASNLPFIFAVLVASIAGSLHCVGMCGGLMLTVSAPKKRWYYHVGRGVSYATIGLLAGLLGSGLYHSGLSTSLKLVSVVFLSALLALSGWQMLVGPGRPSVIGQFFAKISHGLFPKMAQKFGHFSGHLPMSAKSFFAGAASGFLPCGWLYSFVILAIATQSAMLGATLLVAFWLGTLPALVGLSYGAGRLSHLPWAQRLRPVAQRLIGAAFILFAITLILQKTTGVFGSSSFLASHQLAELILQSFTDTSAQPAYDPQSFLCQ